MIIKTVSTQLEKLGAVQQKMMAKAQIQASKSQSPVNEMNFSTETAARPLYIDRSYNLRVDNESVYSIPTKYGMVNYKFHSATANTSDYVELIHFDNHMSDSKRVHLERARQFLQDFQTFVETGNPSHLYSVRKASEVLQYFESFGVTTEEPFTINDSIRYRIDPSGILHEVDLESKTMREKDWRNFGHDENTVFLIQGKEYRMDENGRLPLPEDYVHKYEQVKIFKK